MIAATPYAPLPIALELAPLLAAALLYRGRLRALARQGIPVGQAATLPYLAGLIIAAAGELALAHAARTSLLYHELRLLLLCELAAAPLAVGIWRLPKGRAWKGLRRRLGGPTAPILWLCNLYLWHLPPLLEAGLHHPSTEALECLTYLAVGTNLYLALLVGPTRPSPSPELSRLGQTAVARGGAIVLANLLLWASHATYPFYIHPDIRRQTSPLVDENVAGAVLFFVQLLNLLAICSWTYLRVRSRAAARPKEAGPLTALGGPQPGAGGGHPTVSGAGTVRRG